VAHLPPFQARQQTLKIIFLAKCRSIPKPIAERPGAQRSEGGQVETMLGVCAKNALFTENASKTCAIASKTNLFREPRSVKLAAAVR